MTEKKLNDLFDWKNGKGIFYYLKQVSGFMAPWNEQYGDINKELDIAYHGNHGGKWVSPLVDAYLEGGTLQESDKLGLASTIVAMQGYNWKRAFDAMYAEYNPINNYDMTEQGTDTVKGTGTVTDSGTYKHGEVVERASEASADTSSFNYSYDSADPAPTDAGKGTNKGSAKDTHTGTDEQGNVRTNDTTDTTTHTLTRSGNIGVTTSAQMVEGEIELRKKNYFEMVFADIDSLLTLQIY